MVTKFVVVFLFLAVALCVNLYSINSMLGRRLLDNRVSTASTSIMSPSSQSFENQSLDLHGTSLDPKITISNATQKTRIVHDTHSCERQKATYMNYYNANKMAHGRRVKGKFEGHDFAMLGQQSVETCLGAIRSLLPSIINVLDIGANVGNSVAEMVGINAEHMKIVAVEPHILNFRRLNIRLATLPSIHNITSVNAAVSDRPGNMFFVGKGETGHLSSESGDSATRVAVRTLDDLVQQYFIATKRIDMLKIDTEGFEHQVFLGGQGTLKLISIILWECGWFRGPYDMQDAIDLLDHSGFETFLLSKKYAIPVSRIFWDKLYNSKGWRNCVSLNTRHFKVAEIVNFYRLFPSFADHNLTWPNMPGNADIAQCFSH